MRFVAVQYQGRRYNRQHALILDNALEASSQGAQLCITSELALTGYPPKDLLLYPAFVDAVESATEKLARALTGTGTALVLGSIGRNSDHEGKRLYNQALFCSNGVVCARYSKRLLPFYDVFDEDRYFEPGSFLCVIDFQGRRIALSICEDIWNDGAFWPIRNYSIDPLSCSQPFDLVVNISSSPFTQIGRAHV